MKLRIVLVHFHTPELLRAAVASIRRELAHADLAGLSSELVVVDNGSSAADRPALEALDVVLVRPGDNLGYAGGINRGAGLGGELAADVLLVLNCDVRLFAGALAALLLPVTTGQVAVAGPRFFWDEERRFLLPPAEERRFGDALRCALAGRLPGLRPALRRRFRRHARRHWLAGELVLSHHLPGAVLVIARGAWQRVGPFDERYPLYFEETDWLERARRLGVRAGYVPGAAVLHHFGKSTERAPDAARWFAESAARYRRTHYGALRARLLEVAAGREPKPAPAPPGGASLDLAGFAGRSLWVEVSPHPLGAPFAAEHLPAAAGGWSLPGELVEGWPPGSTIELRVVDDAGRELLVRRTRVGALAPGQHKSLSPIVK